MLQKRGHKELNSRWKYWASCGAVTFSLLFLLFLANLWKQTLDLPVEVGFRTRNHKIGEAIEIKTKNLRASRVESCVWYVGDEEVSRSDKITSYKTKVEEQEEFIRFEVTLKDGSVFEDSLYCSSLPVIYMECETPNKDLKDEGETAQIDVSADSSYLVSELYEGEAVIKLRGNSTRNFNKSSFKIKLAEKTDLLGMGESRHWVLLANAVDASLIRSKLVYDFSRDIGAETWMDSEFVSVVYNGAYMGLYQLCEQVRVGKTRVDIYEWENLAEEVTKQIAAELLEEGCVEKEEAKELQWQMEQEMKADFSWMQEKSFTFSALRELQKEDKELKSTYDLTEFLDFEEIPEPNGGVLLEMDYFNKETAALKTNYAQPFYFNRPYAGVTYKELYENTRQELQALEYAFHGTDFRYHENEEHYQVSNEGWFDYVEKFARDGVEYELSDFEAPDYDDVHYSELVDFDSLLVNFLLCEFTMNWDGMKNSVFLYKDAEGPYHLSLAWDYDWAWGNGMYGLDTWVTDDWHTISDWFSNEYYYQSVQWNRYLIRDPYFLVRMYEKYWEVRNTVIEDMVCDGGLIDQYKETLLLPAMANDETWDGCRGNFKGRRFEEGIFYLKLFMEERLAWLDEQFASVETLRKSWEHYIVSENIWVEQVDTERYENKTEVSVRVTEPGCKTISFQVNGIHFYEAAVGDGRASVQIPNEALRKDGLNTVQVRAVDQNGDYIINPEGTTYGDYTNAVSNYAYF